MMYFLTSYNHPATLTEAKAAQKSLKAWGVATQAKVCHVGEMYGIRTERDDVWQFLPDGMDIIPVEYAHIQGEYPRNWAKIIAQDVKRWGGCVNYAAEAFENVYLDMYIIKKAQGGLILTLAKSEKL